MSFEINSKMLVVGDLKKGRGIAYFIMIVLASLLMSTLGYAADVDIEKDLQEKLRQSKSLLERAVDKLKTGNSADNEITKIQSLTENIKASHLLLKEKFRQREEEVKTRGAKAAKRHQTMEEGYRKALGEYLNLVEGLQPASSDTQQRLENLKALLESILPKKKSQILGSLPYRNLNYPATQPSQAPPIVPAYKGGNKTVSPDDTKTPKKPLSRKR